MNRNFIKKKAVILLLAGSFVLSLSLGLSAMKQLVLSNVADFIDFFNDPVEEGYKTPPRKKRKLKSPPVVKKKRKKKSLQQKKISRALLQEVTDESKSANDEIKGICESYFPRHGANPLFDADTVLSDDKATIECFTERVTAILGQFHQWQQEKPKISLHNIVIFNLDDEHTFHHQAEKVGLYKILTQVSHMGIEMSPKAEAFIHELIKILHPLIQDEGLWK